MERFWTAIAGANARRPGMDWSRRISLWERQPPRDDVARGWRVRGIPDPRRRGFDKIVWNDFGQRQLARTRAGQGWTGVGAYPSGSARATEIYIGCLAFAGFAPLQDSTLSSIPCPILAILHQPLTPTANRLRLGIMDQSSGTPYDASGSSNLRTHRKVARQHRPSTAVRGAERCGICARPALASARPSDTLGPRSGAAKGARAQVARRNPPGDGRRQVRGIARADGVSRESRRDPAHSTIRSAG